MSAIWTPSLPWVWTPPKWLLGHELRGDGARRRQAGAFLGSAGALRNCCCGCPPAVAVTITGLSYCLACEFGNFVSGRWSHRIELIDLNGGHFVPVSGVGCRYFLLVAGGNAVLRHEWFESGATDCDGPVDFGLNMSAIIDLQLDEATKNVTSLVIRSGSTPVFFNSGTIDVPLGGEIQNLHTQCAQLDGLGYNAFATGGTITVEPA